MVLACRLYYFYFVINDCFKDTFYQLPQYSGGTFYTTVFTSLATRATYHGISQFCTICINLYRHIILHYLYHAFLCLFYACTYYYLWLCICLYVFISMAWRVIANALELSRSRARPWMYMLMCGCVCVFVCVFCSFVLYLYIVGQ